MFTAACLISFLSANHNDGVIVAGGFTVDEALCTAGIFTTDHTEHTETANGTAEHAEYAETLKV